MLGKAHERLGRVNSTFPEWTCTSNSVSSNQLIGSGTHTHTHTHDTAYEIYYIGYKSLLFIHILENNKEAYSYTNYKAKTKSS